MTLLLSATLLACLPADEKAEADQHRMQGRWRVARLEDDDGRSMPPEELKKLIFVIKENELETRYDSLKLPAASFTLDPAKKPKALNLTGFGQKRDEEGRYVQNKETVPCIYAIDGDTLKLCLARDDKAPRPKEFKRIKGKATLIVMERLTE